METFNKLSELLLLNRSYRRFDASKEISEETLKQLVNLTRYCASGRNAQPLKYRIVTDKEVKAAAMQEVIEITDNLTLDDMLEIDEYIMTQIDN